MIAVLAGGTGGAKLAAGLAEIAEVAVIANTADDVEVYGVHVAPDPDLISYRIAGIIDERGFGIRGDTFAVMAALRDAGRETWFQLGDRDLAMCLIRTEALSAGARLTDAHGEVVRALSLQATVLPMSDDAVRTFVRTEAGWRPFQEFMIRERAEGPISGVELRGVEQASPTPEVLDALAEAEAIVIGPSNPVISIGPILALSGMRQALAEAPAPVIAVSPYVRGEVIKGPTAPFMEAAGFPPGNDGVLAAYEGLLDGIVADEPVAGIPALVTDTLMSDAEQARRLATETVDFAASLR